MTEDERPRSLRKRKATSSSPWPKVTNGDNWETPPIAYEYLKNAVDIPAGVLLWDPFYSSGRAKHHLEAAFPDNAVHHENRDFFDTATHPTTAAYIVVTNPPFSKMSQCIHSLCALKSPLAILVRCDTVFTKYFGKASARSDGNEDAYTIIANKRIGFIDPQQGIVMAKASFSTAWVVRGLRLKNNVSLSLFAAQSE